MRVRLSYAAIRILAAAVAGLWIGLIATGYGNAATAQAISNVGLAAAALAAAIGCAHATRRDTQLRRVWLLLGLSCFSWGSGMVIWTWYETALGRDPFPSLADVGYLASVPFAAAALLSLPTASQTLAGRIRTVIDGLMIASSLLLIAWVLVLDSLFHAGGDLLSQSISLAYPLGDIVVVTIVLYVFLRARRTGGRTSLPLGLVGGGLGAIAVADFGFVYLTATETYSSGNLIDIGWFVGYTLILLAALKPQTSAATEDNEGVFQDRPLGMLLPYVAVGAAMVVSSIDLFKTGGTEAFVAWTRTFIVVMMMIRQILTLLENLSLTRHLEARVDERTAELRASEQRFAALVQHSSDVVTIVDVHANVLYQSESVHRVLGYTPDQMVAHPLTDILEDESAARLVETLSHVSIEPYAMRVLELSVRHQDGHRGDVEMTITNLLENPSVRGLVLNTRDISAQKALEDQLVHEAFHDSLTTLANRALFKDRVEHALRRRGRSEGTIGILFLDLDGFKEVNDSLGHASGDQLLALVGQRLSLCVRGDDTVARLGGDEFAVLIEDEGSIRIEDVAERMTSVLREPFSVDGHEIHVRGSIGIATNGTGADEADQLLRNADLAMYRAKAGGEGGVERYDPDMHADLIERLQLGADLRRAIETDELVLHYQPILNLSSGTITGVEALIRWKHPTRGLLEPAQFIALAEDRGMIHEIGRWVLATACHQAVLWQRSHAPSELSVSVNISGRQLKQADLVAHVDDALSESGLNASNLVLEITESVLMEHTEENLTLLKRLRQMGVRLAIDDFGTGYSSLSYLHRFPVDMLKIDRSFVDRLRGSVEDAEVVRTIVRLGQSLGMATVAEGIEDHAQFLALKRIGCELGQGFHFSRPVPADQINLILDEDHESAAQSGRVVRLPSAAKRIRRAS